MDLATSCPDIFSIKNIHSAFLEVWQTIITLLDFILSFEPVYPTLKDSISVIVHLISTRRKSFHVKSMRKRDGM